MSASSGYRARPQWSAPGAIQETFAPGPLAQLSPDWAWGGSTGRGVKIAVIDSGIDHDHPAVGDSVRGGVSIEYDEEAENGVRIEPDDRPSDSAGHGTACAGIIHALAPEAEIYSVRVLGKDLRGRAVQIASGLSWAMEHGMHVANGTLSASRQEYYGMFHEMANEANRRNMVLVSAVSNLPLTSSPSLYAALISVAAYEGRDPFAFYYSPAPAVEFAAPGVNVRVAWRGKQYGTCTGNTFAAPHIAGIVALIRSKHPELDPFQIKTVLWACAANTRRGPG
jgi:subtilisin